MTRSVWVVMFALSLIWVSSGPVSAQITVQNDDDSQVFDLSGDGENVLDDFSFLEFATENSFGQVISDGILTFTENGYLEFELLGTVTSNQLFLALELDGDRAVRRRGGNRSFIRRNGSGRFLDTTLTVSAGQINPAIQFLRQNNRRQTTLTSSIDSFS